MHPERTRQPAVRRAPSRPPAGSSTVAAWNAFLLRAEARAWISASEQGRRQPEVSDVALEVLLREYERPARLLLGLAAAVTFVVSATLSVATVTVLNSYSAEAGAGSLGIVVFIGVVIVIPSAIMLLLLQVSGYRMTRSIAAWSGTTPQTAGKPEAPTNVADTVDRREAVASRALFLTVSGVGIAGTVGEAFWLSSAEGGSFVLPLVVAAVLQLIIWLAVCFGVVRVLRSSRV